MKAHFTYFLVLGSILYDRQSNQSILEIFRFQGAYIIQSIPLLPYQVNTLTVN